MATQVKTDLIANNAITDAKIANVAITGVTASSGDSSTALATTAFVAGEINSLIDSAPGALNTLNELAAAMGDDANFSTTVTNSIAAKLPLAGGLLTGNLGVKAPSIVSFRANSNEGAIQYGKRGVLFSDTGVTTDIANNTYVTSGNVRNAIEADLGSYYQQYQGYHKWFNAPSVSAGAQQTFAERMGIDSGGDVKINTGRLGLGMDAAQALDIERTSGLSLRFYNGGTFKAGLQAVDGSGQMVATSAANDFAIRSQSNLLFSAGGNTERMRIDSSGKVGIGTNGPARKLHIKDSGQIKLENTSTDAWAGLDIHTSVGTNDYDMYMGMLDSDGRFFIDVNSNGEDLTILQNGNVGIGINNPGSRLTVGHAAHGVAIDYVGATLPSPAGIFTSSSGLSQTGYGDLNIKARSDYGGNYSIGFFTASSNNAPALRMKINSSGSLIPAGNNLYNLGETSNRFANIFTNDLNLSNEGTGGNDVDGTEGNWTIQEGKTDLYIINNKNGKKYKFALEEL